MTQQNRCLAFVNLLYPEKCPQRAVGGSQYCAAHQNFSLERFDHFIMRLHDTAVGDFRKSGKPYDPADFTKYKKMHLKKLEAELAEADAAISSSSTRQ